MIAFAAKKERGTGRGRRRITVRHRLIWRIIEADGWSQNKRINPPPLKWRYRACGNGILFIDTALPAHALLVQNHKLLFLRESGGVDELEGGREGGREAIIAAPFVIHCRRRRRSHFFRRRTLPPTE